MELGNKDEIVLIICMTIVPMLTLFFDLQISHERSTSYVDTSGTFIWNANASQGDPVFIFAIFSNDTNLTFSKIILLQVRALTQASANTIMANYIFQVETNTTCFDCPKDMISRKDLNFTLLGTVA